MTFLAGLLRLVLHANLVDVEGCTVQVRLDDACRASILRNIRLMRPPESPTPTYHNNPLHCCEALRNSGGMVQERRCAILQLAGFGDHLGDASNQFLQHRSASGHMNSKYSTYAKGVRAWLLAFGSEYQELAVLIESTASECALIAAQYDKKGRTG